MDPVEHPLDWWAAGGYELVMRELRCAKNTARHKVRAKIAEYFKRTSDPLWRPVGHRGYAALRGAILENRVLDNELK